MHTQVCDMLGIEFPIFAFTHCRDVVAAVSKAGGLGVLGAVGFTTEQLKTELDWIDEHVGDKPYGVDTVIPGKYEGMGELDPEKLEADLVAMIPEGYREFADKLLDDHGVPPLPDGGAGGGGTSEGLLGWTDATAGPQVDEAMSHPNVRLLANALGTPPADVIEEVHSTGRYVAALCGAAKHALAHKAAGVDIVIAQGTEGGGHTGDVGSMVLWPEVVDAVGPATPVLAAGGVGCGRQMAAALALGAQGVWTGSLWLTVEEAAGPPSQVDQLLAAGSRDTVRSRSFTGKPARMLRNDWTEAWEDPENPGPLGMPLQWMVTSKAVARMHMYADKAQDVMFNPVGQVVGRLDRRRPSADVVLGMVEECIETMERMGHMLD